MLYLGLGLLAAALLLVVIEAFVPSGGLISLLSAGCAVGGVVCLFRYSTTWGLVGLLAVLVLGPMAFGFALKVFPSTPIGRKMIGEKSPEQIEADRAEELKEREARLALIGSEGIVRTDLRPVGIVEIDGKRLDALSEVALIRTGTRVRVTSVEGTKIKVRPVS